MLISITNLQKKLPIDTSKIEQQIRKIINKRNVGEVSVVFVGEKKIRQLNKKFFGRDSLTDVLSFDNSSKYPKKNISWEIIICTDIAIKNSKIFNTSSKDEVKLYLAHGILHLLGYDDNNQKNRIIMRKKEKEILKILNPI